MAPMDRLGLAVILLALGIVSLWIPVGFLLGRAQRLQQQLDGLRAVVMGEDE